MIMAAWRSTEGERVHGDPGRRLHGQYVVLHPRQFHEPVEPLEADARAPGVHVASGVGRRDRMAVEQDPHRPCARRRARDEEHAASEEVELQPAGGDGFCRFGLQPPAALVAQVFVPGRGPGAEVVQAPAATPRSRIVQPFQRRDRTQVWFRPPMAPGRLLWWPARALRRRLRRAGCESLAPWPRIPPRRSRSAGCDPCASIRYSAGQYSLL